MQKHGQFELQQRMRRDLIYPPSIIGQDCARIEHGVAGACFRLFRVATVRNGKSSKTHRFSNAISILFIEFENKKAQLKEH